MLSCRFLSAADVHLFIGCFDPGPCHPLAGRSAVMTVSLLDGSWLFTLIISTVSCPAWWPFCCFSQFSYYCFLCSSRLFFLSKEFTLIAFGTISNRPKLNTVRCTILCLWNLLWRLQSCLLLCTIITIIFILYSGFFDSWKTKYVSGGSLVSIL